MGLVAKMAVRGSTPNRRGLESSGSSRQHGRKASRFRKAKISSKISKRSLVWARKNAASTFIAGGRDGAAEFFESAPAQPPDQHTSGRQRANREQQERRRALEQEHSSILAKTYSFTTRIMRITGSLPSVARAKSSVPPLNVNRAI